MTGRVYATADQVWELVGITLPADSADLTLRRASRAVDRIVRGAEYDVDDAGLPTDPQLVDLFAEMVAEQVAWYAETGDETGIAALSGGSIGRVTLPTVGGGRESASTAAVAPNARDLARNSGLLMWRVRH